MRIIPHWLKNRRPGIAADPKTWCALGLALVIFFGCTLPVHAWWLPWATEGDRISRRLNEIWAAIVAKDRKKLQFLIVGTGAKNFIDQEIAIIDQLGIESVTCQVTNLDAASDDWAFVVFDRTDKLKSGGEIKHSYMKAMKLINNDWKLLTNLRKRDRPGKRYERQNESRTSAEVKQPNNVSASQMAAEQLLFQQEPSGEEE